ncbi:MAG: hypothetical protein FJZ90_17645, partial [Chloroflexi bacterium]|nr:hypothetical protein [Chloroflexota bacterium]
MSLLLAFSRLLVRATGRRRGAAVAVPLILVVALLTPTVSPVVGAAVAEDSGGDRSGSEPPPRPGSELARLLEETRALAAQHLANGSNPASALADKEDEDGDGLPNGYELRLGTSPFAKDSDYDGLSDYDEVIGMPCEFQGQSTRIETNPLDPDSNHDGLTDGKEFWRGQCTNGYRYGYAWHDDNDQDGVPDGLDLSPFSRSGALGGPEFASPNLTVETLDQDPSEQRTVPYPFYVEVQIRPYRPDSLRWAYKNLYWPTDHEGSIRKPALWASWMIQQISAGPTQDLGTSSSATTAATGKLTLVPFLQATLRERDLPSEGAMAHYGVSASPHKDEHGNPVSEGGEPLYDMAVPLIAVERGGQVYAFQAKMLHDRGRSDSLTRHWRDLRLKWAVIGDVLLPDEETGVHVRSPEGGYGLVVYDEPYYLTGLQVSRQGGASMLVAAALPSEGSRIPYDDGPIALLRGGLEAQFLTGRLDMGDIKARFDTSNSASDEQRWGIPQSQRYRIVYDASMHYGHLDEAVATTTMTTTRQLLNKEFAAHTKLQPTLILASEQRTSTVNLDDDPATDYLDITINTCLKPLITSRSLKLQTYRWRRYIVPVPTGAVGDFLPLFGEWVPL